MVKQTVVPLIIAGGAGTRLWPVSRQAFPKPFLTLPDGASLLQKTLQRAALVTSSGEIVTVTNRDYTFQTRDTYALTPVSRDLRLSYLLEPVGRNTAPAIAIGAHYVLAHYGPDAILVVLPADHLIADGTEFQEAVTQAVQLASAGHLVTFGIMPTGPDTGFGYIEQGDPLLGGYRVRRFIEKPKHAVAQGFLEQGGYLWNSGMFCFTAGALLNALASHAPEWSETAKRCWDAISTDGSLHVLPAAFADIPNISLDYAVMEKADNAAVVLSRFSWSDIGSWSAYARLIPPDARGNRALGDPILIDADRCLVHAHDRVVALLGTEDLLVIDTPDALLIAATSRDQDVKGVVTELKKRGHEVHNLHRTAHRPWGTYTVLEEGSHFKIKRLVVKPGQALSLQMHHHRSEHWVVVSGTAKVVNGTSEKLVRINESTYIPSGTMHRLSNPGTIDLVLIEVQSGQYLGEDDIVRMDDQYGRS